VHVVSQHLFIIFSSLGSVWLAVPVTWFFTKPYINDPVSNTLTLAVTMEAVCSFETLVST